MKIKNLFIFLFAISLTFSCQNSGQQDSTDSDDQQTTVAPGTTIEAEGDDHRAINVTVEPASGSNLSGNITFTEANGEVTMKATIHGLNPGQDHAIHIHEKGDCSADDANSACGQWHTTDEIHCSWGSSLGTQSGDVGMHY